VSAKTLPMQPSKKASRSRPGTRCLAETQTHTQKARLPKRLAF
jgi:hypothetical protein